MEKIKGIKLLRKGQEVVRFNKDIANMYEFIGIHPRNKKYVLMLDETDQNAYKFYIPDIYRQRWFVNASIIDILEEKIKYYEERIETVKNDVDFLKNNKNK